MAADDRDAEIVLTLLILEVLPSGIAEKFPVRCVCNALVLSHNGPVTKPLDAFATSCNNVYEVILLAGPRGNRRRSGVGSGKRENEAQTAMWSEGIWSPIRSPTNHA